jgi:hypothetical protein
MAATQNPKSLRTGTQNAIAYRGEPFAPSAKTYGAVSARTMNLTTVADSGYGPCVTERLADLGAIGPIALAALWEAGFALEAGPLSTWSN